MFIVLVIIYILKVEKIYPPQDANWLNIALITITAESHLDLWYNDYNMSNYRFFIIHNMV